MNPVTRRSRPFAGNAPREHSGGEVAGTSGEFRHGRTPRPKTGGKEGARRAKGGRHHPRLLVGFLVLAGCLAVPSRALAGGSTWEYWPEIDLWARLTPQFRLSSMIAVSRNIETQHREGSFILQADYAWKRKGAPLVTQRLMDEAQAAVMNVFLVRGGYLTGKSLTDNGAEYSERTGFLEFHRRTPLKGGVLLSSRIRTDLRFLGEAHDFS